VCDSACASFTLCAYFCPLCCRQVSKSAQPLGFPSLRNEARQVWADLLGRVEVKDGGSLVAEATAAMMAGSTSTSSSGESSVVDMGDDGLTEKHLVTFYTGLWRALTFPRRIDEIDANGKQVMLVWMGVDEKMCALCCLVQCLSVV